MAQKIIEESLFSPDIRDFLILLHRHNVDYLIVGGEAVIYYGYARLTGDIDIFFNRNESNVKALYSALSEFWDNFIPGLENCNELLEDGLILQFGRAPNRIDIINSIDGIGFEDAKTNKLIVNMRTKTDHVPIFYIGLKELIINKETSGRPKDIDDLEYLRKVKEYTT